MTVDVGLEVGHFALYKLSGTFTFLKAGFGFQEIIFERFPTNYCGLFYLDAQALVSTLAIEYNSKSC